mmetsp:Transcript_50810/g.89367  ORF Transcript_50810/g.89367 Transcript_50810/m.89367 type:complete len:81 (-) Transcript_50810:105-347(-)
MNVLASTVHHRHKPGLNPYNPSSHEKIKLVLSVLAFSELICKEHLCTVASPQILSIYLERLCESSVMTMQHERSLTPWLS